MKQAIIVRTDLKMSRGKLAVQVAHASLSACERTVKRKFDKWKKEGEKKVVLRVKGLKELCTLYKKAKKQKLVAEFIKDSGRTQLKPGTITTLAIGPDEDKKIDKITGHLKLL